MFRPVLVVAGAILVVASGLIHGFWTGRWGSSSADPLAAAARLDDVAQTIGSWEGADMEVDAEQLAVAQVVGHLSRRYIDRETGTALSVLIVCGRPGPIAVHPPDICYRGAGYELVNAPAKYVVNSPAGTQSAEFWMARSVKTDSAVPSQLEVFRSWSASGVWKADNPRLRFAGFPALYKLYVVRDVTSDQSLDSNATVSFIQTLLSELDRSLFSDS